VYEPGAAADAFDGDQDGFSACQGDCDDANPAFNPGVREVCDALDNDCNGMVDGFTTTCGVGPCFRTGTCTGGMDSCIPGTSSLEICDALDNDCNGFVDDAQVPAGSPLVTMDQTAQTTVLGWEPLADATSYDVVVGDLGTLIATAGDFTPAIGTCLALDFSANSLDLPGSPAVGAGLFYLVRGRNCGGWGSYDSGDPSQVGSCDAEIDASPSSCTPVHYCGDGVCDADEDCSCASDCFDFCCIPGNC
jgi:hypothetical protein